MIFDHQPRGEVVGLVQLALLPAERPIHSLMLCFRTLRSGVRAASAEVNFANPRSVIFRYR